VLRRSLPLLFVFGLPAACTSSSTPSSSPTPSPSPSASSSPILYPSPSASPATLTCTYSGDASANWPSPSTAPADPAISNLNVSGDSLTITFIAGTPAFSLEQTTSSTFTTDPQGAQVTLAGTSGILIHLTGFRGDISNYTGAPDMTSPGPALLEVRKLGDFEGHLTFGAGLAKAGCAHVTTVPNGSSLTFEFITKP
jgi:hypothetical protein